MTELFADLPEAIDNTIEIARRCAFRPREHAPILPRFVNGAASSVAQGETEAAELRRQSEAGLARRLAEEGTAPGYDAKDYAERLAFELDVITGMKFPGYFLIVADFIQWAKAQGIPVGPGPRLGRRLARRLGADHHRSRSPALRAAVRALPQSRARVDAGLRHRLLPGPPRRGDRATCSERYGADRVAQIITFGKLQARAVLRDVGRVLQMPYGQVDRLCKLVPQQSGQPGHARRRPSTASRGCRRRATPSRSWRKLLEIAQQLEGLYRHASTHAAGMVIGDRPLTSWCRSTATRAPSFPPPSST